MSDPDAAYDLGDFDHDLAEDCPECFGEGGWNYCMEDCCPMVGGEEACIDRRCWQRCECCDGKGFLLEESE